MLLTKQQARQSHNWVLNVTVDFDGQNFLFQREIEPQSHTPVEYRIVRLSRYQGSCLP